MKNVFWREVVFPADQPIGFDNQIGLEIPSGATSQRPTSPINGTIRYNTSTNSLEYFGNGTWESLSVTSVTGEANTGTNIGAGLGIYAQKVGPQLQFRSLIAGSNVTLTSLGNEIQISASSIGESNTGTNIGGEIGLFSSKVGTTLQFRTLRSLHPAITIQQNGDVVDFNFDPDVSTAILNGANIGSGVGIFDQKAGTSLRFKSLVSTGLISISNTTPSEISLGIVPNPTFTGTGSIVVPKGTTAQRPTSPVTGMIRYNTTTGFYEGYQGSAWDAFSTATGNYVSKSGDTMIGNLVMAGTSTISMNGGNFTMFGGSLVMSSGAGINMTAGGNITMNSGATVDGYDVSAIGQIVSSINTSGEFGFVTRTNDGNVYARRTLTGAANQISISNGNGVSGNPVISITNNPVIGGTGAIQVPSGTTGERPTGATGKVRVNTSLGALEYYSGSSWRQAVQSVDGSIIETVNFNGANITMTGNETVDGRDLSVDGVLIDQINSISSGSGLLTKNNDGDVVSTLINASTNSALYGINVNNGAGGDNPVEIGLDINNLEALTDVSSDDEIAIYDVSSNNNKKITIGEISVGSTFDSIEELRNNNIIPTNKHAFLLGYYTPNDGGGGSFWYDASDTTSTDNGGTIIVDANGKRWKRIFDRVLSVLQCGAIADGDTGTPTDNRPFFQTALDNARSVYVPPGAYRLKTTWIPEGREIFGAGDESVLMRYDASTGNSLNPISGYYILVTAVYSEGTPDVDDNKRSIVVRDLKIDGRCRDFGYASWSHSLTVASTSDMTIERVHFYDFRGDGLYLGMGTTNGIERHNERVRVRDCIFDGRTLTNRNGIAVIDCDDLMIEGCLFKNVGNTALASSVGAIDYEPNQSTTKYRHAVMRHNQFININSVNTGGITLFNAHQTVDNVGNIEIYGNYFERCYRAITSSTVRKVLDGENDIVSVYNNEFVNSVLEDVVLGGLKNVRIRDNILRLSPPRNVDYRGGILVGRAIGGDVSNAIDWIIDGNTLDGLRPQFAAVNINGARGVKIQDNYFYNIQGRPIALLSNTTAIGNRYLEDIDILNNVEAACTIALYSDASASFEEDKIIRGKFEGNYSKTRTALVQGAVRPLPGMALASPPTTGTFEVGDKFPTTTYLTDKPMFHICTTAGTFGTLTGVSCSATAGSPVLTNFIGADAEKLREGQYITMSGMIGAIKIIGRDATAGTITIDRNFTGGTGAGKAVYWSAPAFNARTDTVSADKGNAAATLGLTSDRTNVWNSPLTADRTVTLATVGMSNGHTFRIVRTAAATGAFNLNVGIGPLKALGIGEWCEVEFNGSAWVLTASGTL